MSSREGGAALATFSMVFGLLSIPCFSLPIPALPAVILGHIALGHFGSAETKDARARAWIGLLLGYMSLAVFGIFAILFAIGTLVETDESGAPAQEAIEMPTAQQETPAMPRGVDGADRPDDVFLLEGDARYHRFFCRETGDQDMQRTRLIGAIDAGFRACDVCQPDSR